MINEAAAEATSNRYAFPFGLGAFRQQRRRKDRVIDELRGAFADIPANAVREELVALVAERLELERRHEMPMLTAASSEPRAQTRPTDRRPDDGRRASMRRADDVCPGHRAASTSADQLNASQRASSGRGSMARPSPMRQPGALHNSKCR